MGAAMWESDLSPHGVTLTFGAVSARIALEGSVDVATGVALVDAATSAVSRFRFLDLDLAAVTSIDDPGVRSLVKIKRFADAYGAIVSVVEASQVVGEALVASGLDTELGWSGSDRPRPGG